MIFKQDRGFAHFVRQIMVEHLRVRDPRIVAVLFRYLERAPDDFRDAKKRHISEALVAPIADNKALVSNEREGRADEEPRFLEHFALTRVGEILSFVQLAARDFPFAG